METDLIELQRSLVVQKATLATAESLTAGDLAAAITSLPGASEVYLGGVVTYATEFKRQLLKVTAEMVISAECAAQMAAGVRDLAGATWAVSTTGVAGPGLQEGQPVGTAFVGVAGPQGVRAHRLDVGRHSREQVRRLVVVRALELLRHEVAY